MCQYFTAEYRCLLHPEEDIPHTKSTGEKETAKITVSFKLHHASLTLVYLRGPVSYQMSNLVLCRGVT